jgi:hypothetical protein
MATPLRQPDPDPQRDRPRLAAVPGLDDASRRDVVAAPADSTPPEGSTEPSVEPAFEDGLAKATAIGGAVGFLIVFALAAAGLHFISDAGLPAALAGACFVGAFGGLGSGAMMAASLHKPSARSPSSR